MNPIYMHIICLSSSPLSVCEKRHFIALEIKYLLNLSFFYSTLEGFFVDDALQGQGMYTNEDGGVLYGTYVDGELNGPAQEFDGEGCLMFRGQYKNNSRFGECWFYHPVS